MLKLLMPLCKQKLKDDIVRTEKHPMFQSYHSIRKPKHHRNSIVCRSNEEIVQEAAEKAEILLVCYVRMDPTRILV